MKLPVFSFIGVVVFLLIIIFGNHMISRETFLTEYRAKFHIEPKISDDGTFTTVVCTHTPSLVGKTWVPYK